jgi:hypothetical protein
VLYAVAKGDARRVQDFYRGPLPQMCVALNQ